MTNKPPPAIVIKAATEAEVQEVCDQLAHLALFGDVFRNKYEGGYACKGVLHAPEHYGEAESADALAAQLRQSAAMIGRLQEQVEQLKAELAWAEQRERGNRLWHALDTMREIDEMHNRRALRRNGPELAGVKQEELERWVNAGWHWGEPPPPTPEERLAARQALFAQPEPATEEGAEDGSDQS
jgi:hypothetical protein